jgi:hypothetical protein
MLSKFYIRFSFVQTEIDLFPIGKGSYGVLTLGLTLARQRSTAPMRASDFALKRGYRWSYPPGRTRCGRWISGATVWRAREHSARPNGWMPTREKRCRLKVDNSLPGLRLMRVLERQSHAIYTEDDKMIYIGRAS